MMMNIAICDDDKNLRDTVESYILQYLMKNDNDFKIKKYESGESLLKDIDDIDLVFLDYDFEDVGANGMVIARAIRQKKLDVTIIFLTSYTSIVYEAFEVAAFRFLVKPIDKNTLFTVLDAYFNMMNEDKVIVIKKDGTNNYIKYSQISYIEADGKNSIIHYVNKKDVLNCSENLAKIEKMISNNSFFRCHKSFLVHMKYVDSFSRMGLKLQNGEEIIISRPKYRAFCEAFGEYIDRIG